MKAVRLSELRDLLKGETFSSWWKEYCQAVTGVADAQANYDELLSQSSLMEFRAELAQQKAIETLDRVGDLEDVAAKMSAEDQELENRSLEMVADFEELRFKVSEVWYRLGGLERAFEEKKDLLATAKRVAESDSGATSARGEVKGKLHGLESSVRTAEREYRSLHEEYVRDAQRKSRLWDEVERMWSRSFEFSLLVAENIASAKRIRRLSDKLFKEADERKARAHQFKLDAEAAAQARDTATLRRADLLLDAKGRFGCISGDGFLYWRQREDQKAAYAVPLSDDGESFNVEAKALTIYSVTRQRGVQFLEPPRSGPAIPADEGDKRIEDFLLQRGKEPTSDGSAT